MSETLEFIIKLPFMIMFGLVWLLLWAVIPMALWAIWLIIKDWLFFFREH